MTTLAAQAGATEGVETPTPPPRASDEARGVGSQGQLPAALVPEVLAAVADFALSRPAAGPEASHSEDSTPVETLPQMPAAEPPLPWRRQRPLAGPAGPIGLSELATVAEAVEHLVERHVERVLDRRMEQVQAQAGGQPSAPSRPLAEEILDDNVARALMRKLQSLAEEERSRQGYLR